MGIFDLRCKLSGLSTRPTWWDDEDEEPEPLDWSLLLLEEIDGVQVPLTLPVTGSYDHHGTIEFAPEHQGPLLDHVEQQLARLHRRGSLTVDEAGLAYWRQRSQRHSNFGTTYPCFLGLGSESIAPRRPDGPGPMLKLWHEGHPVQPCLFLAPVAAAIAASPTLPRSPVEEGFLARLRQRTALRADEGLESEYAAWLLANHRPRHAAYLRAQHDRRQRGWLTPPAPDSAPVAERLHRLLQWSEPRGGLPPVGPEDSADHEPEDAEAMAHQAWVDGDPILHLFVEAQRPDWAARWRQAERAAGSDAPEASPASPYRPDGRHAVGEFIAHQTFGLGCVEQREPGKIRVRFGAEVRTLAQTKG